MQFLFDKRAEEPTIRLTGDEYRYIFRVRRAKLNDTIALRNLKDSYIYYYKIISVNRREATLKLLSKEYLEVLPKRYLHIGWCIIEPKNVEKTIPFLNEIGVAKITFFYCKRSQRSYRLDFQRLEKIAINSSQQSGRSSILEFAFEESLESFLRKNPEASLLDFSKKGILEARDRDIFVVGCEGGFTKEERELFGDRVFGFDSSAVLQSQTAATAIASILLL